MRKQKRLKNKRLSEADIDLFCRSVEAVLTKIHDRSSGKKGRAKQDRETEEELVSTSQ